MILYTSSMGFFGWLKGAFKNGVSGVYNSAKSVIGKVYSPIHEAVNIVGKIASKADDVIKSVKDGKIPIISQLARVVADNPIYKGIQGAVATAQDIDKTAQEIGSAVDNVASPLAQTIDKTLKLGPQGGNPMSPNN